MKECYMCGISEEETLLYEGIHKSRGVVYVCRKCYFKDKIPLVEKKEINMEGINKSESVRERLSKMAHVSVEKGDVKKIRPVVEDVHLKDLVEKNFKKEVALGPKEPVDIVHNFHWIIMRKRRSLKLSKEELAKEIYEPVIAIESLEKGVLPRDYRQLVKKIESRLGIHVLKNGGIESKDISLESKVPSGILLSELKGEKEGKRGFFGRLFHKESKEGEEDEDEMIDPNELDMKKIEEISGVPEKNINEKRKDNKKELSDEDIRKLAWGK